MMKKTILIFTVILAAVFVTLSILDKSEYKIEKQVWHLQKKFNKITKDPKVMPDREFERLATKYRKLIKKYPKSDLTPQIYLKLGLIYAMKKDFPKARSTFSEILSKYPDDKALRATTLLNIGNTYESQDDEQKAIQTYRQLIKEYPQTDVGLNVPLYISNYYLRQNNQAKYEAALDDAISFYKEQSKEHPKSQVEFNALRLLVTAYYAKKDWRSAVDTLSKLLLDYADSPFLTPQRAGLIIKSINTVSLTQLKDNKWPGEVYRRFIQKNPGHSLVPVLEQMIDAFKKLEDEDVTVNTGK